MSPLLTEVLLDELDEPLDVACACENATVAASIVKVVENSSFFNIKNPQVQCDRTAEDLRNT
jgi:hypothetical protein